MESNFISHGQEEPIELPPGFRFHPTDDELIIHYLYRKVCDSSFASRAIGDVALNKFEPWDLPLRAKIGEKEWYFFCVRDRKYPTGLRTNRATESGYWKATGNDKEIYKEKALVGMKKTLVFYKGRAPNGEKTNWVMHEFRLDGKLAMDSGSEPAKGEWVISKVFEKSCGGKKIHISGVASMNRYEYENDVEIDSSDLPPLIDTSSSKIESIFDAIQEHKHKNQDFNQPFNTDYLQYHEPSIMRFLTNNENYLSLAQNQRFELRNDQDYNLDLSDEPVNLGCLWN